MTRGRNQHRFDLRLRGVVVSSRFPRNRWDIDASRQHKEFSGPNNLFATEWRIHNKNANFVFAARRFNRVEVAALSQRVNQTPHSIVRIVCIVVVLLGLVCSKGVIILAAPLEGEALDFVFLQFYLASHHWKIIINITSQDQVGNFVRVQHFLVFLFERQVLRGRSRRRWRIHQRAFRFAGPSPRGGSIRQ